MKRILILLLFMGLGQQLRAQEEFLKLDSISVLEVQANWVYNGQFKEFLDTVNINPAQGQICVLRNAQITIKEPLRNDIPDGSFGVRYIYEAKLDLNNTNLLQFFDKYNGDLFSNSSRSPIRGNGYTGTGSFMVTDDFNYTIIKSSNLLMNVKKDDSWNVDVFYRVELVYYSYE